MGPPSAASLEEQVQPNIATAWGIVVAVAAASCGGGVGPDGRAVQAPVLAPGEAARTADGGVTAAASGSTNAQPDAGARSAHAAAGPRAEPIVVYCFAWVHGLQSSTDCFRSMAECRTERAAMSAGHRDTRDCLTRTHATCTRVLRSGKERCFGDRPNCERFRTEVGRQGTVTDRCLDH